MKNINKNVKIVLEDLLYIFLEEKMENKNEERIDKLTQQQLIDSI